MNVSFLCVFRWVPFELASPRLDKKSYVILSEIANSQNQCSLLPHASETLAEPITSEHEDMEQGEANDHFMGCSDGDEDEEEEEEDEDDDDDEMYEIESEDPESKDNDINNILIGLYGSQYRYKVKETPFLRSLLKLFRCHQCLPLSSNSHVDNETKNWIWKDLRKLMNPVGRKQLEPMLKSYCKVVGEELSERMVYEIR